MGYGDRDRDRGGRRSFGDRPMGGDFERRSFAPVKVGDELEVTIESVGAKGDGVAKKDGFVLFVPNAKQGENVKIRVTRVLRKVGFAEIVGSGSGSKSEETSGETSGDTGSSEESGSSGNEESQDEQYDASQDTENFGEDSEESQ